jgi:hypothetical protein
MPGKSRRLSARGREAWTRREAAVLDRLRTPGKIQAFLERIPYNTDDQCRSPRRVMAERRAHCMEGALMAAAALRYHGFGCRILDLMAVRDDDHVIALFRQHGCWGAVAKSNFSGLRFREPVYRNLRELAMSYFESYFNTLGEKTLRSFSRPVDLRRFDGIRWMTTSEDLEVIGDHLNTLPHTGVLTPAMKRALRRADRRAFQAGMVGCDPKGLYRP